MEKNYIMYYDRTWCKRKKRRGKRMKKRLRGKDRSVCAYVYLSYLFLILLQQINLRCFINLPTWNIFWRSRTILRISFLRPLLHPLLCLSLSLPLSLLFSELSLIIDLFSFSTLIWSLLISILSSPIWSWIISFSFIAAISSCILCIWIFNILTRPKKKKEEKEKKRKGRIEKNSY